MGVSGASLYSAYVCASPRRRRCAASWARKKRRPPPTHPHLKIVDNSRLRPALEVAVSRVFQGFSRRLPSHPALSRISQISCLPTAVYAPATVYYVAAALPERDQLKGQSLIYVAGSGLGGALGNLLGGRLLDRSGIQAALLLGTVSAAASLLTFCLSTREDSR